MKSVEQILKPRSLTHIVLLVLPFMAIDFLLFPVLLNADFMYEIDSDWRIPAQLLLVLGSIVVFVLNLIFLKILQDFTRVIPVIESKIIFRGAIIYVFTSGFLPILIEVVDLLLIILGISAFPAVIYNPDSTGFNVTEPGKFSTYKEFILLEFLLRDLFFTLNLLGGILLCVFFAIGIYRWRKLLGEKSITITIMIPGYLSLGVAWLIELIKVNLLYLTPITYFSSASAESNDPYVKELLRRALESTILLLDFVDGGALVLAVICGVIAFIPVFNQLTDIPPTIKKTLISLALVSPVLLLITLILGREQLGLGSSTEPRELDIIMFLFNFSIFLPLFLVGVCYYYIGKNLNDDYLRNFMFTGSVSAVAFPWLIGIPEPEIWFGTVFTPFLGFMTVGCIYLAGVMAGVNSSVMEEVRRRGMEITFLTDVERAIQIENLARDTEKLLKTAVEEIKEKTKITPQFNPRAYAKAFEIGIQSALNQVDFEQDVDNYIKEALELYTEMMRESSGKDRKKQ